MPFSDDQVFELTKTIYKEIYENFTQNYIGQKQPLQQFQENYIQPLYPAKKIQEQSSPGDQTVRQKVSQYRHKYDQQIIQFSESAQSTSNQDNQSSISYFSAVQKYSIADLVCRLRLGRFFLWNTTPPDNVYEDLGLGICLYLKFMKHLVYVMLILTILSAIVMSIFYSIAQSNKFQPGLSYQKVLFSLGVGSLSLQGIKCIHQNVTNIQISFNLACPVGYVRVLGPVYSQTQFQTLQTCKKDMRSFLDRDQNLYLQSSQFTNLTDCDQSISNCTYNMTVSSPKKEFKQISVTYECINGKSTYGAVEVTRNAALYVAVIFDLLMIVSLMMFYWSQQAAQKKQQKYFKQKQILLNAFTLQIGTFSKRNFNEEFKDFIQDLQKAIKKQDKLQLNLRKCIIQVRLPDNSQYDDDQGRRQDAYRNMYEFIGENFIEPSIDPDKYIDGEDFRKSVFNSQGNFKSYRRRLGRLINQYRKVQKLRGKNSDEQLKIYVVFLKPKYKRLIMEKTRVILGRDILEMSKKDYEIIDPPAPSLILWNNIGKNKLVRGIISWVISLTILLGTYVLTAYILSIQDTTQYGEYDFNIQCQNVFLDQNYNQFNQLYYKQYKISYTHCYCLSRSIIFSFNFQEVCNSWRDQYSLYLALPVLYGLGLFVLNELVSTIYRKLSEFEAHQYLTSELYSYIIKKTILQTTDLSLIIVLLSIDFNKKSKTFDFLLIGSYDDLSADWHLQVGIIIIVNMFFNVFSPFVEGIFYIGETIMRKLRLCFFHKKDIYNKTKMNYIENYREDVFPVQERYASILAVLFVCLALNCIYPIMTAIMALTLLLYQVIDKLMIIKAYHKPLNFQGLLQKKIMKVFLFTLLLHMIVTAIYLTQPFLIVAGETSNSASIINHSGTRIQNMFKVGYCLPYMILFVVIIIFVLVIFVSDHYFRTKPNPRVRLGLGGIPFEENKYYNLLDAYELDRTTALKRRQIQRNKILENKYMRKYTDQDDLRQSQDNKPMIPTTRKGLVLNTNKSILSQISQYSYYRLLKKKVKTSKDQQKLVKIAGMAAYEWEQDWIYFDQEVRLDYKIPQIDSYLNKIAQQSDHRRQLIHNIIELAMLKKRMQGIQEQQIEKDAQILQQKQFAQIINDSHVTSVQEQTHSLQIQNTHLPILQLEKLVQMMQRKSFRDKSVRQSNRGSRRMSQNDMMNINLKINNVQLNKVELQSNSQRSDRKKPHNAHQPKRQQDNQLNQNSIQLQIQSNKSKQSGKQQHVERSQVRLTGSKQLLDMEQVESEVINSSDQEDNQNQKLIEEQPNPQGELNASTDGIRQKEQTQAHFDMNHMPSQKILREKDIPISLTKAQSKQL